MPRHCSLAPLLRLLLPRVSPLPAPTRITRLIPRGGSAELRAGWGALQLQRRRSDAAVAAARLAASPQRPPRQLLIHSPAARQPRCPPAGRPPATSGASGGRQAERPGTPRGERAKIASQPLALAAWRASPGPRSLSLPQAASPPPATCSAASSMWPVISPGQVRACAAGWDWAATEQAVGLSASTTSTLGTVRAADGHPEKRGRALRGEAPTTPVEGDIHYPGAARRALPPSKIRTRP